MPKVSVIIPVYNTEKYLPKCLDSLTAQTLSDIEIICINDCSPDNSLAVLQEYAQKDNRIKIINLKKNKGASAARNAGIDAATGEYIGFVDSDDYVDLDFYEKLYNKAKETNADAVKGNVYNYDVATGKIELTGFYNQNDKIRKNSANFCYGFTSAIYKLEFIRLNQIDFPENVTYFEDPYFSIKACLNYKKIAFVDDAKYYYLQHNQPSVSNHATLKNMHDFEFVTLKILSYINSKNYDYETYIVVFNFLYNFANGNAFAEKIPADVRSVAQNVLVNLVLHCKYDYDMDKTFFTFLRNEIADNQFYDILLSSYQPYDYLNKNDKRPLIKILVSYIKPSFLFKTKILTPIHLGRAVEKENSKDGPQSEENLNWLHENCDFNDDFEAGISQHNRRIGFFTGTYWAWKNYEKLGNPEYFGSFGYRKLLFSNCLENINDYDFVAPKQMSFEQTLKNQFIECHGAEYYEKMLDVINTVYPEENIALKEYMERTVGYYAEMYIMKKNIFFDFCNWMFRIVKHLIEHYPVFIESHIEKKDKGDILLDQYLRGHETFNTNPTDKDIRDFAFILERLSGYYLYKLTKNPALKWKEVTVFEPFKVDYKKEILNKMRRNVKLSLKKI